MNELKELKQYLKFYDEARDNDKMTAKEQRELCKTYAQTQIEKIIGVSISVDNIKFDRNRWEIVCEDYGYNKKVPLEFKFYQDKCSIWDGSREINLSIA
ncbi:hypothetical protein [Clostridium estertheticum]|uniref:hypothetical protein n=1 Tax=Clostridium estertheticum TaxID=238834 RepID=UPI001C0AD45A|nr:hypothetical protein [Clostridium estertheticum]MBU3186617.1 hypothetical protein [Clostridium estertheticum]